MSKQFALSAVRTGGHESSRVIPAKDVHAADGTRLSRCDACEVLLGDGLLDAHLSGLGVDSGSCHSHVLGRMCCTSEPQLLSREMLLSCGY